MLEPMYKMRKMLHYIMAGTIQVHFNYTKILQTYSYYLLLKKIYYSRNRYNTTVGGELENMSYWKKTNKNKKKIRENIFSLIIIPNKKKFKLKKIQTKKN